MFLVILLFYFFFVCTTIPKTFHEACDHPRWRNALIDENAGSCNNGILELVPLFFGKKTIGCRWVYAAKSGPSGEV